MDLSTDLSTLLGNAAIITMVGHEAFARGMVYARNGKVTDVELDPQTLVVSGRVQGGYRDGYATSVQLVGSDSGWTGHQGRCTCPVAMDCKHAAALLVVARGLLAQTAVPDRSPWEVALGRLIDAPAPAVSARPAELGLELAVETVPTYGVHRSRTQLRMRPVRRSGTGKWLRSGVSWDELDFASRDYRPEHRDLLLQLRSAAGAAARFSLPRTPWLGLGEVSAGWWSLLGEAARAGLELVVDGRTVADLVATRPARLVLDTRQLVDGTLSVVPRVLLDGEPLAAGTWGLLGDPAHGIYLHRNRLMLARLAEPVSRELRRLLDDPATVLVPAADRDRFVSDFVPALRRRAVLVSTDSSFAVPPAAEPDLELTVSYRPEHRVRMDWAFGYDTAGGRRHFDLGDPPEPTPFRDPVAERRLLAALPIPDERLPQLGTADGPVGHVLLAGMEAAVFVEQVLPGLRAAGVVLTELGERVEYRRSDAALEVELATAPTPSADWFDLHVTVRVEGEPVPFEDLFVAVSRGEEFLVLDTGVYLPLDRPELEVLRGLIEEARLLGDDGGGSLQINRVQSALWEELVQLGVVGQQAERWIRAVEALAPLAASADGSGAAGPAVPAGVRAELRPYQVDGFGWLARLWAADLGGILADDMGLGKTLQTLALVAHARAVRPGGAPFLVVAPTSVVPNWAVEASRFVPDLSVVTVAASQARDRRPLAETVARADLVVTSYALLRLDADAYAGLDWSGLVLDEAQFVKNHRARTYAAARRVAAPFSLAITGTPLENSLMDLWALFSITAPGLFPDPERFSEYYRRPIERDHDAERLGQLRRRVRPLMLRRTKEAVATELPPKQEQVVDVVLQPRHQRIYQTYLQRERQKVLGLIDDLEGNRFTILRSLTLLRQLSLDPALVDPQYEGAPASKVEVLLEMLEEVVGEGHQALVFSQFTGFLDRVQVRLAGAGIPLARLDGRTRRRGEVVDRFRRGEARVFLVSLKAGGFGLNLTEAGYCFVLDPWWNPAAETQAVDRAHRIGQDKTVHVYRLVARDTIEQKVMDLKARKSRLFEAVLGGDALDSAGLGEADIREILSLPAAPEPAPPGAVARRRGA